MGIAFGIVAIALATWGLAFTFSELPKETAAASAKVAIVLCVFFLIASVAALKL